MSSIFPQQESLGPICLSCSRESQILNSLPPAEGNLSLWENHRLDNFRLAKGGSAPAGPQNHRFHSVTLKGSVHRKKRGVRKVAVVSIEYGILALQFCLSFNFAFVFSSTYIFPFPPRTDTFFR
jgi:hypothetical protein